MEENRYPIVKQNSKINSNDVSFYLQTPRGVKIFDTEFEVDNPIQYYNLVSSDNIKIRNFVTHEKVEEEEVVLDIFDK